jgi:hypothetical protein
VYWWLRQTAIRDQFVSILVLTVACHRLVDEKENQRDNHAGDNHKREHLPILTQSLLD